MNEELSTESRARIDAGRYLPDETRVTVDADLEELMPGYLLRRRREVQTLRGALHEGDLDRARHIGHGLKGNGGGYGLFALTRLGAALEAAGREGDGAACAALVDLLERYLDELDVRYAELD